MTEALKLAKEETERLKAEIVKFDEKWQTEFLRLANRMEAIERNYSVATITSKKSDI